MKLIAKFAFAFFLATATIIAFYSYFGAKRQVTRIEDNVVVDLRSLGGGLRAEIRASWQTEGEEQALRIVSAAQSGRSDVEIKWLSGVPSETEDHVEDHRDDVDRRVTLLLPVRVDDVRGGTLVLTRSIPDAGTIFRNELGDELLFALVLALALGALAVTLGGALIGRPLERIVAQARRIGEGDLSQRLREDRTDEIGELKREFNAMCDRLLSAQKRLDDEAASRLETLEQLRHLDRLRSVGTMASSVAHELGTPLNVLLLRGQSLVKGETDQAEIEGAGRTIVGQVEKMSRIVRQMLDFSRAKEPTREKVAARKLVMHTIDLLAGIARKNRVELSARVDTDCVVEGDPSELEQALTNLVMNAIQAMPKGGTIEIVVHSADATPPRAASIGRGAPRSTPFPAVTIDVVDEGPGIETDALSRIFEPFYTTKRAGEGTGLGLSVASGIAEDHGGFISAKSELGKGSTFTLTLPRLP